MKVKKAQGGWLFWCPGCNEAHKVGDSWQFDGNEESPTFSPSVLTWGPRPNTEEELSAYFDQGVPLPNVERRCHSFIRAGQIEFLSDCSHGFAGSTLPLPEWKP